MKKNILLLVFIFFVATIATTGVLAKNTDGLFERLAQEAAVRYQQLGQSDQSEKKNLSATTINNKKHYEGMLTQLQEVRTQKESVNSFEKRK